MTADEWVQSELERIPAKYKPQYEAALKNTMKYAWLRFRDELIILRKELFK